MAFDSEEGSSHDAGNREDYAGVAALLDVIATEGARRGVNFEQSTTARKKEVGMREDIAQYTPGQAEFMHDSVDPLTQMIDWAHETGIINESMRLTLQQVVRA